MPSGWRCRGSLLGVLGLKDMPCKEGTESMGTTQEDSLGPWSVGMPWKTCDPDDLGLHPKAEQECPQGLNAGQGV